MDRLVYVNANLRLLEKCRGPDGLGVLVWKPIQVNPDDISMEPGDISHLQPHTSEDDVYDFLREEVMIRRRNTRSMTRRCNASQGVATVVEASTDPMQRGGRGTLAYSRRSRAQRGKARMNEVPSPHQSQENESSESEAGTSSSEDSTNVDGWFADETDSSSSSRSNGGSEDEDSRD